MTETANGSDNEKQPSILESLGGLAVNIVRSGVAVGAAREKAAEDEKDFTSQVALFAKKVHEYLRPASEAAEALNEGYNKTLRPIIETRREEGLTGLSERRVSLIKEQRRLEEQLSTVAEELRSVDQTIDFIQNHSYFDNTEVTPLEAETALRSIVQKSLRDLLSTFTYENITVTTMSHNNSDPRTAAFNIPIMETPLAVISPKHKEPQEVAVLVDLPAEIRDYFLSKGNTLVRLPKERFMKIVFEELAKHSPEIQELVKLTSVEREVRNPKMCHQTDETETVLYLTLRIPPIELPAEEQKAI